MLDVFALTLSSRLARRSSETYQKLLYLGTFSRLGSFPQIFGHVKE